MLLQGVLALVVLLVIVRYRRQLEQSAAWRFVATRPLATGCFVGGMAAFAFYERSFLMFTVAYIVLVGIPFARLLGSLLEAGWKKQLVYALVLLIITTRLLQALNLPQPLFRLYMLLAALVGLVCFLRWALKSGRDGDAWLYPWGVAVGCRPVWGHSACRAVGSSKAGGISPGLIRTVPPRRPRLWAVALPGAQGARGGHAERNFAQFCPAAQRHNKGCEAAEVVGGHSHWGRLCGRFARDLGTVRQPPGGA